MQTLGMRTARLLLVLLTGSATFTAAAAGGGYAAEKAEPVPTGAELAERCADYRDQLEFTRAQLKARNLLGRWDFLVAEHRKREQFVAEHCPGGAGQDAAGDGDQAMRDAAGPHASRMRQS